MAYGEDFSQGPPGNTGLGDIILHASSPAFEGFWSFLQMKVREIIYQSNSHLSSSSETFRNSYCIGSIHIMAQYHCIPIFNATRSLSGFAKLGGK